MVPRTCVGGVWGGKSWGALLLELPDCALPKQPLVTTVLAAGMIAAQRPRHLLLLRGPRLLRRRRRSLRRR